MLRAGFFVDEDVAMKNMRALGVEDVDAGLRGRDVLGQGLQEVVSAALRGSGNNKHACLGRRRC